MCLNLCDSIDAFSHDLIFFSLRGSELFFFLFWNSRVESLEVVAVLWRSLKKSTSHHHYIVLLLLLLFFIVIVIVSQSSFGGAKVEGGS